MNPEIYSEWLRRQGKRVLRTASSYWNTEALGVYRAFPEHWTIEPSRDELRELTLHHRAIALRYSAPAGTARATNGYHVVYMGADYDFEALSGWARKNVRRGLRSCDVRPISFSRYVEDGWDLRRDTLARQGRRLRESREDWNRRYSAAADLSGFAVWAAEVNDRLAATLMTFQMNDWAYMVYQQCHRDYLREHVNNALSFVVTQHLIRNLGVKGVYYGMSSLDAPASVDEFKFRMGYEARPVRQRVEFHPYLRPLVNAVTYKAAKLAAAACRKSRNLAKTEGMFRLLMEDRHRSATTVLDSRQLRQTNDRVQ